MEMSQEQMKMRTDELLEDNKSLRTEMERWKQDVANQVKS